MKAWIVVLLALNIILLILSSPVPSYTSKDIQYEVINSEEVLRDKDNFEKLFNEFEKKRLGIYCLWFAMGILYL